MGTRRRGSGEEVEVRTEKVPRGGGLESRPWRKGADDDDHAVGDCHDEIHGADKPDGVFWLWWEPFGVLIVDSWGWVWRCPCQMAQGAGHGDCTQ